MGGKSTYLRQTALICLMAQAGSFVPAREAKIPLVDRIFARVGASDNIARGQSTFMVEMQETANILHTATSRSLVVLDEIGRGTATFDGLSIAWAVAEHLATNPKARPKTLFATHYHELTDLADATPGVVNFHVAAREWKDDIVFLHKIVPGRSDRSYGIQVARLAGLPRVGHRSRARDPVGARTRRADARRAAVGQRHADRSAAAARAVSGAAPPDRPAPAAGGDRRRSHDAARGADAAGRSSKRRAGRMTPGRASVPFAGGRRWRLAVSACIHRPVDNPNIIVMGVTSGPNNLDPRIASDDTSQKLGQLIFSSLMTLDEHLRAVPQLAERIENPDPLTWVITVRRGVKFHDGHELTSADVRYTFRSLLAPGFISPLKGAYRMVRSVDARDRYTVVFNLNEPFATFPGNLVVPPIAPDGAGPSFRDHPIGTGPYKFVSHAVDDRLELAAFDDYYGGRPRNDGLVFRFVPDDIMRGLELRKGTMDLVVNDIAPDIVHQLERQPSLQTVQSPGTDYQYIGVNLRDPILRDVRVRQALAYAVDYDAIIEYSAPRARLPRRRNHPAGRVGVRAGRVLVHARSRAGEAPARRGRLPGSRRRRSRDALHAVAEGVRASSSTGCSRP